MVGYWLILAVAVVTEILWALSLKYIQQHPGPWPVAASLGLTLVNMALLSLAMRGIPAGVAYAVYSLLQFFEWRPAWSTIWRALLGYGVFSVLSSVAVALAIFVLMLVS